MFKLIYSINKNVQEQTTGQNKQMQKVQWNSYVFSFATDTPRGFTAKSVRSEIPMSFVLWLIFLGDSLQKVQWNFYDFSFVTDIARSSIKVDH